MDGQSAKRIGASNLLDFLERLTSTAELNKRWDISVEIARELGADALNVVHFHKGNPMPVWFRVSTHERGGMEEYVARDYMSVDPVLTSWWSGTMHDVDHISLHRQMAAGGLSAKTLECYEHLLAHGQSDYITFRIQDSTDADQQVLVVFACTPQVAAHLQANIDQLAVVSNLFAVCTVPPTPNQPEGKVPLLYEFLTPREAEVLSCVAKGMQNDEIAHALGVSEVTVRMHTTSARKRMGANTRAQAVALALLRNLIRV